MNKNKLLGIFISKRIPFKHFLLIMRLTLILLITSVFCTMAETGFSQNVKVTINKKNVTLKEVLNEIEKQTDYLFIYNDEVDVTRRVTVKAEQQMVPDVLGLLFKNNNIDFSIEEDHIILSQIENKATETGKVQQQQFIVKGKVTDPDKKPLPGATITIVGTTKGVITDNDGNYSIDANPTDKLVFSFVGMESQVIDINNRYNINVQMGEKIDELEEVTVVAFGKQKRESVLSSIATIKTEELRVPSSNLTTAFAGRIAGIISYQTSGEPGYDNADFFIRGITTFGTGKVNPLILIDNVEVSSSDLSKMHPDDIQSFSILKDATATALYGARGANGVILITTKEGKEGKVKVNFRIENSFSQPTKTLKMADPISYMRLANEAASTRDPLAPIQYSNSKIDATMNPDRNQYVYPAVDWLDLLTTDIAINQRANLNISGGGDVARYYIAGSFSQDNGILKVDKRNNFNSNVNYKKYLLRSNININLTKSTEAIVRLHGTFDDYLGPITGGSDVYKNALRVSPVRFPTYFEPDKVFSKVDHILFGGFEGDSYMNPYAEMLKGYREESKSNMMAQMELKQNFSKWLKGLTGRLLGNTTRTSGFDLTRAYSPFYYQVSQYNRFTDEYSLLELNPTTGNEYVGYSPGYKSVVSSFYGEASLLYDEIFNERHAVSGMLVSIARNMLTANASTLSGSLPQRNLGISGRFTYGYDNRYFAEFNFGYNGSEKFDKNHRWGFFPSVGLGWSVNNEQFWKGKLKEIVSKLKIRGTYGLVGNDEIGSQRFFYLSEVTIGGGGDFTTGYNFNGINHNGVLIRNYANPEIGWEIAEKTNLGIELGLFKGKVEIQADLFHEYRKNILQSRADVPAEMGLWQTPQVNVGEAQGKGVDISLDYNHSITHDFWVTGRANFTYARSTYLYFEEAEYARIGMPWRSKIGHAVSQRWGYVAERLFIDEADIENSPRQDFGEYLPGDIKYKDINGDNIINEIDMVPIGYPVTPEINYGFGLSAGYKNFDVSIFFQGQGRSSFWIDGVTMSPFRQQTSGGKILETGLAQFIADDHWTELSQNPYAAWPRLSNTLISNNNQRNTWFLRNSTFFRLKSAEIGYELQKKWVGRLGLSSFRCYLSGTNLLLFSNFKLWDVEMGGNGLGYPLQRVYNIGINLSF